MISAELLTNLKLDTSNYTKNLKMAEQSTSGFSKQAVFAFAAIATFVAGTLTYAFVKFIDTISETADKIDKLADTANNLNIDVRDLQKLQFAAQLSGVSSDKLDTSLKRMIKTIAEAESGNKSAIEKFKQLGISIEDIANLNAKDQLQLIGERIKGIGDYTQQAKASFDIFGRSGTDLIQLLTGDLGNLSKEFDALGLGITDSQAKATQSFNDSRDKLGAIWESFKQQLTVQIVPAFQQLIEWVEKFIVTSGGLKPLAESISSAFVGGIITIVQGFQGLLNRISEIRLEVLKLIDVIDTISLQKFDKIVLNKLGVVSDKQLSGVLSNSEQRKIEIARLEKEQKNGGGGITGDLVKNLTAYQQSIKNQNALVPNLSNMKLDITLEADKEGILKAVINSTGFSSTVGSAIKSTIAEEARRVNR